MPYSIGELVQVIVNGETIAIGYLVEWFCSPLDGLTCVVQEGNGRVGEYWLGRVHRYDR